MGRQPSSSASTTLKSVLPLTANLRHWLLLWRRLMMHLRLKTTHLRFRKIRRMISSLPIFRKTIAMKKMTYLPIWKSLRNLPMVLGNYIWKVTKPTLARRSSRMKLQVWGLNRLKIGPAQLVSLSVSTMTEQPLTPTAIHKQLPLP